MPKKQTKSSTTPEAPVEAVLEETTDKNSLGCALLIIGVLLVYGAISEDWRLTIGSIGWMFIILGLVGVFGQESDND